MAGLHFRGVQGFHDSRRSPPAPVLGREQVDDDRLGVLIADVSGKGTYVLCGCLSRGHEAHEDSLA